MEEYDEPTKIPTLVSGADNKENKKTLFDSRGIVPIVKRKITKILKLSEITKPLTLEENQKQMLSAVKRILYSPDKLDEIKSRIVCSIAVNSTFDVKFCKLIYALLIIINDYHYPMLVNFLI